VLDFLAEPFRWVRDVAVGCWNFLTGIVSGISRLFAWVGRTILNVFINLPIMRLLRATLGGVFKLLSGDASFYAAGKAMIVSLGRGIWSAVTLPLTMLCSMVQRLFGLFTGDSFFGEAGKGIIMGLVGGMVGVIGLPLQLIGSVVRGIIGAVQGAWQGLSSLGQGVLGALAAPFEAAASLAGATYPALEVPEANILAHGTVDPLADAAIQDHFGPDLGCHSKSIRPADDWGWVHGELITFAKPVRALPPMDRLEGFRPGQRSSYYQRVLVPVWAGDRIRRAWAYVMTAGIGHQFLPQGSWPPISGGL
jgi:hypothetical protein